MPRQVVDAQVQYRVDEKALLILLTQDCDIMHHDYDAEPTVELHVARPAPTLDGNLFHAKNPRRLQFEVGHELFEIHMREKFAVPRVCLLHHIPRPQVLNDQLIRMIVSWTANRYIRSSYPDEFNSRLRSGKEPIRSIVEALKRQGDVITGIFLSVDPPREISVNEIYRIVVRLTVKPDLFGDLASEVKALEISAQIQRALGSITGVDVEDFQLVSEAEFSVADLRLIPRWDYDYLSYRAARPGDIIPGAG